MQADHDRKSRPALPPGAAESAQARAGAGEILIKVAAADSITPICCRPKAIIRRRRAPPQTLGMEISGTVAALGEGVSGFAVGDKVCALIPGGGYAEYAVAAASAPCRCRPVVTWSTRRRFPKRYSPSGPICSNAARLKPGERVLVHGGSSGIGVAAIQLLVGAGP